MLIRFITTILILAVLACPMWCGIGGCIESECGVGKQDRVGNAELNSKRCCCCSETNRNAEPQGKQPDRCPDESPCQGVCGGAVVERPCEFNSLGQFPVLAIVDAVASFQSLSLAPGVHPLCERSIVGGNQGRFLCTLYETLIC